MPQRPVVRPSGCPRAVWPLCCSQVQAGVLEPALASAGRLGADRPRAIRRVLLPVGLVRGAPRLSPPPPPLPLPSMPSLPLVSGLQPSPLRLRPSPPVSVPPSLPPSSLARQPPLPAPNPNPTSGPAPLSRKLGVARPLRVAAALVRSATHHNPSPEPEPEPEDPRHCPPPGRRAGVCRSRAHYYNYYYIKPSWREHADNSTPSPHPSPHPDPSPSPNPNMQVAVEGSYYVSFRLLLKIDSVRTLPAASGHASHPSACLTLTLTLNHRSACRAPSSSTPQTTCDRSATSPPRVASRGTDLARPRPLSLLRRSLLRRAACAQDESRVHRLVGHAAAAAAGQTLSR